MEKGKGLEFIGFYEEMDTVILLPLNMPQFILTIEREYKERRGIGQVAKSRTIDLES